MSANVPAILVNDDDAVTVDWVVLTGSVVIMAAILMATMSGETSDIAIDIEAVLTDVEVARIGTVGYAQ